MKTEIKTVTIKPTKDMPFEIFKACYHLSYFMELMERLPNGNVIWDSEVTAVICEDAADIEYELLQSGFFQTTFEIPEPFNFKMEQVCNQ